MALDGNCRVTSDHGGLITWSLGTSVPRYIDEVCVFGFRVFYFSMEASALARRNRIRRANRLDRVSEETVEDFSCFKR